MPTVAAIIVTYQKQTETIQAVQSLLASAGVSVVITIVHNGAPEIIAPIKARFPSLTYIQNNGNEGFAAAVNQGIAAAHAHGFDYLLLVNDDAYVTPTTLATLIEAAHEHPAAGIIGPSIYYKDHPEKIWQGGGFFSRLRMNIVVPDKDRTTTLSRDPRLVDFVTGCVMLLRAELVSALGGLDEDFFFYVEDLELCLRAKKAGFAVLYVPAAQAYHDIPDHSAKRSNPFALLQLARSTIILYRKHFSVPLRLYGYVLLFTLYAAVRFFQHPTLSTLQAWYRGILRGIRFSIRRPLKMSE